MPVRPAVPTPKPLSPRATAYVRHLFEEAQERRSALEKAVSRGFAEGVASVSTPVRKAKSDPPVAIYDADGNLIGTCDPGAITELAPAPAPDSKPQPAAQQAPAAPADPNAAQSQPAVAAKAMSAGVRPGTQQLGGATPAARSGTPVVPVDEPEDLDTTLAKAAQVGRLMKAKIGPNSGTPAAEQAAIIGQMNGLALAALSARLRRP